MTTVFPKKKVKVKYREVLWLAPGLHSQLEAKQNFVVHSTTPQLPLLSLMGGSLV